MKLEDNVQMKSCCCCCCCCCCCYDGGGGGDDDDDDSQLVLPGIYEFSNSDSEDDKYILQ
jgi:hypothetical protein